MLNYVKFLLKGNKVELPSTLLTSIGATTSDRFMLKLVKDTILLEKVEDYTKGLCVPVIEGSVQLPDIFINSRYFKGCDRVLLTLKREEPIIQIQSRKCEV